MKLLKGVFNVCISITLQRQKKSGQQFGFLLECGYSENSGGWYTMKQNSGRKSKMQEKTISDSEKNTLKGSLAKTVLPSLNILDLYSGFGGWIEPWIKSNVYRVSIDAVDLIKRNPAVNHLIDAREFKTKKEYDIFYASPPCNTYFSRIRQINKKPITKDDIKTAKELAELSFKYGEKAKLCYIIENPATGLMTELYDNYQIVDYSMYGFPMRKRTAIWSNIKFNFKLQDSIKYNDTQIGKLTVEQRNKIPWKLSRYVKWMICNTYYKQLQEFKNE